MVIGRKATIQTKNLGEPKTDDTPLLSTLLISVCFVQFDRRTLEDLLMSVIVGVVGSYLAKAVLSSLIVY